MKPSGERQENLQTLRHTAGQWRGIAFSLEKKTLNQMTGFKDVCHNMKALNGSF
ncbi:hypothetical protein [Holospora undulata]|uniref:hypothetical protein n=1 Tax=Holospora undulata TaxID=1169117 RepID=UPI00039A7A45|nr:hypothetical protein [Holospora undulata]